LIKLKFRFVADYKRINIYAEKQNKKLAIVGKKAAGLIKEKIQRNILEGRRYDGRKVAKLLPSTIKRKKSSRPLVHSLALYKSIAVKELAASYKIYVKPLKGLFGSKTPRDVVARILQNGSANMRARPFFGTTQKFRQEVDREMKRVFG
jgi:hypothetical protein